MYAHELFEQNKPRVVVTYPGRFQPWHSGHSGVFSQLQKKFGAENVFIATSNDQSSAKSPFNFSDKYQLMTAAGVPADKIIQTNAMYALPEGIDPLNTIFITAVGAPDADRLNPDSVLKRDKKDKSGNTIKAAGSPGYYKKWDPSRDPVSADQHGYVIVIPEIKKSIKIGSQTYDVSHGTETRNLWNAVRDDEKSRLEFLSQLYGRPSSELANIFDKIPQTAKEDIAPGSSDSTSPIHGGQIYEQVVTEGLESLDDKIKMYAKYKSKAQNAENRGDYTTADKHKKQASRIYSNIVNLHFGDDGKDAQNAANEYIRKSQGMVEGATVTRIDSKPITDFGSSLKAYKHTDDWSQSGLDTGDDSYWKNKNLKTNTTKGLFAGDPRRTALYATGNAHETRYVEFTQNGQPIVYFDQKDLPAMRSRKTYLTVFDASNFRQLPTGEWFSENPGKPIKQVPIGDPFKYIASQGWIVRVTDDLDKVFKQVKNMHKAGKIAQYGAEGMNESKQGVAEGRENYNGVNILFQKDDDEIFVKASAGGRELGHVLFVIDGDYLMPQDLEVEERYQGQGIAATMYDYVKSKGYKIRRSGQQTDAGAGFWDKHKPGKNVWEQTVAEGWSQKYKRSINCSHPKGFSQKAHCAGKRKHNESVETEMVCEDCGMCETHGDHSQNNLMEACWKGYHKEGMKTMFGKRYPNCVKNKNESLETYIRKGECPGCGGEMVGEGQLNEKQDACYHKVKSRYKVWPSAYASGALVQCRKKGAANWGNKSESITQEEYDQLDENLKKWFSDKWVRFGPDGKIRGPCARGSSSEGKPKCLPQSKAHALGKKGRASAGARKRKQDPDANRSGRAINVATKKKSNEDASGVIATKKQARDPRYSMSLTKDVRPGQIEKNLRAFKLAEQANNNNDMFELFAKFLPLAMRDLGLTALPKIVPKLRLESTNGQASFGRFVDGEMIIQLAMANRHPVDILRTLAHELVHYKQKTLGKIKHDSGETGSPEENQANTIAGIIMRHFNKEYPDAVNMQPIDLNESQVTVNYGIGKNPGRLVKVGADGRVPHAKLHVNVNKNTAKKLGIPHFNENFADGRNPGDKGSLKAKVKGKVTMTKARAILNNKNSTARAKQLAHWFINMNKGRNK